MLYVEDAVQIKKNYTTESDGMYFVFLGEKIEIWYNAKPFVTLEAGKDYDHDEINTVQDFEKLISWWIYNNHNV